VNALFTASLCMVNKTIGTFIMSLAKAEYAKLQ
jgi:hypothetical protein